MMESETLQVLYDYSYEYKEKKISIVHDEKLKLLQRTNQHWWKVVRPNHNRPFFVPASYVQTVSLPSSGHEASSNDAAGEMSSEDEERSISSSSAPLHRHHHQNLKATTSTETTPAHIFRIQHSPSLKVSSPRHLVDGSNGGSMSMKMKRADSSRNSKRALKVKNWSASLEELSKQIVFPGLTSESVMNLSEGSNNKSPEFTKTEAKDEPKPKSSGNNMPGPQVATAGTKPVPLPRRNVAELQQQNSTDSFIVSSPKPIPKTRSKGQLCDTASTSSNSKSSGGSSEILNSSCEELDNEVLLVQNNAHSTPKSAKSGSRKMGMADQYNYSKDKDSASASASNRDQDQDHEQQQQQSESDMKPKQPQQATIMTIPVNSDRIKSVSTDSINSTTGSITTLSSGTGTSTKPSSRPSPPSQNEKPLRLLLDNWAEYCTAEGRHYYYNNVSEATSWKPPRINSLKAEPTPGTGGTGATATGTRNPSGISYHHNGASGTTTRVIVTGENHYFDKSSSSTFAASRSHPLQDKYEHRHQHHERNQVVEEDEDHETGKVHLQYSSSNNSNTQAAQSHLPVPDGYTCSLDATTGQLCYVNDVTGAKWFSSQDPQGKIYYYEENSAKSSWFLPVPGISVNDDGSSSSPLSKSTTSDSLEGRETTPPKSSGGNIPMPDVVNTLGGGGGVVKKRYSTGDVADRSMKARSLIILDPSRKGLEQGKIASLPRSPQKSIWSVGFSENEEEDLTPIVVIKEGQLSRTRITENGKKIRKNWSTSYVVLTEKHLSLFKDLKSFANTTTRKSEMEIELAGANLGWAQDKSSRKNVFQLNTSADFQILFQCDDKDLAAEWFEKIAEVVDSQQSDYTLRLRSTSPDTFLDLPVGEKKNSSTRLGRAKSTKVKITGSVENLTSEERSKIRAQLKKFFNRRPPRESLVKKGIYKDEAVFGCHLEKLCSREEGHVPRFVQECIRAIESKEENLKTDGIYRASGNLSQVQKMRLQVDQNNLTCLYQEEDVHVLAGSLKLFFREMKEPLIPSDLFDKALAASNLQNRKERVSRFRDIVSQLAKPNRATLCYLLKHLLKVSEYSEYNRMMIPNLAIVFGPTLMWPAQESTNMALDLMRQNFVIEALLQDYETVFEKK